MYNMYKWSNRTQQACRSKQSVRTNKTSARSRHQHLFYFYYYYFFLQNPRLGAGISVPHFSDVGPSCRPTTPYDPLVVPRPIIILFYNSLTNSIDTGAPQLTKRTVAHHDRTSAGQNWADPQVDTKQDKQKTLTERPNRTKLTNQTGTRLH